MIFELTPDLLTLLQNSYVSWQYTEFGAACVDPKRPYGNSDVLCDVCELLGWAKEGDDGEEPVYSSAQRAKARALHEKTGTAMEIVLHVGAFTPGTYKKDGKWKLL